MIRPAQWIVIAWAVLAVACKNPYRVGEHVWVEWDGRDYPAYIIEKKSATRFRVHYEGYDSRWDEDVTLDRIKGRVEEHAAPPPPPEKVARASGATPKGSSSVSAVPVMPYKVGDRIRVRWRGSVYAATVVGIMAPDRVLIHYDGHESAWDESITIDRIVSRR